MKAILIRPYKALPAGKEIEVTADKYRELELSGYVASKFLPKSAVDKSEDYKYQQQERIQKEREEREKAAQEEE